VSARWATGLVIVALAAAGVLIGISLAGGGLSYGASPEVRDPCAPNAPFPGDSLDSTTQRVALRGLDAAACELGLTREELLFAIAGEEDVGPSSAEIEAAVRRGLERAVDEEDLNPAADFLLRQAIRHAPEEWVLAIARELGLLD
jgi:hypothetical protein